jgi:hypothetical protein
LEGSPSRLLKRYDCANVCNHGEQGKNALDFICDICGSRKCGSRKWCSRQELHLEPPPSQGGVQRDYTSGAIEKKEGCAMPVLPRRSIFGRDQCCCYTNDACEKKWWLLPELHRTLIVFSEALIYLSYAAMAPHRGSMRFK